MISADYVIIGAGSAGSVLTHRLSQNSNTSICVLEAGRVVELLGMKGEASGGARVSEVHANFIVAADGATAADVLVLIRRAMRRARDELGITLRTEVQLVGDFGPVPAAGASPWAG